MNASTTSMPSQDVRISGFLVYLILNLFGLTSNLFVLFVFFKFRKQLFKTAFTLIAVQLLISDLLTHLVQLYIAVPLTLHGTNIYGNTLFHYLPAFFDTVAYNGTLLFIFLISVNLFTMFLAKSVNHVFFSRPNVFL
ncbi:hypothetical protein L596_021305 [Steinernema carpocapsae]|uniref:G-protein coupled receptors family 1 profile domain-containing protein n=1 Tax=Steinernema carpocapsae TaxID=34508 RepID=A0A4U5MIC6_STECR|nr:hypothetical protein L596_021305 [Steinernema carpocapsae]